MKEEKPKKDKRIPSPRKITPEVRKRLFEATRLGMSYERAAEAAGIASSTFTIWRRLAKEDTSEKSPYRLLMSDLKKADAEGELYRVGIISKAANNNDVIEEEKIVYGPAGKDGKQAILERVVTRRPAPKSWQAAAHINERRYPERWGKKPVEVKTTNNIAIDKVAQKVDLSDFSKEELDIIRKMSDEKDTEEVKSLSDIESEHYES